MPADVAHLIASLVAHVVAFWVGLRLLRLAIDLSKQDVAAPYTIAIDDFKNARRFLDCVSVGVGAVGAVVCLLTAVSLVHYFWCL